MNILVRMLVALFITATLVGCVEDGSALDSFGKSLNGAANEIATGVSTGVNANLTGEDIVRGRVAIQSPVHGYLTCFKDIRNGYVSTYLITNPSQAQGTPMMIMTTDGLVTGAICDDLQAKGLLVK